jgi:ABC-2 type transport system permease protein
MMGTFFHDTWWVAWRELKHFLGQRVRILLSLVQPVIWLTLVGNLFGQIARVPGFPAGRYLDYMAPGVIVMVTLFAGIYGGLSVVWDRRMGFLQKLLAAPISRASMVYGKMLAIGVQSGFQSVVIFFIAMALDVKFSAGPLGVPVLVLLAMLLTMVFAGISLAFGAVIHSHEALMAVINFFTLPLVFTSSAMMPASMLPGWLAQVTRANPLTYAVGPMRALFLVGWEARELLTGIFALGLLAVLSGALAAYLFRRSAA